MLTAFIGKESGTFAHSNNGAKKCQVGVLWSDFRVIVHLLVRELKAFFKKEKEKMRRYFSKSLQNMQILKETPPANLGPYRRL